MTTDTAKRSSQLGRPIAALPEADAIAADPRSAAHRVFDHLGDRAAGAMAAARILARVRFSALGDAGAANLVRNGRFLFLKTHAAESDRPFGAIEDACRPMGQDAAWPAEIARRFTVLARAAGAPGRRIGLLAVPTKPVLYWENLPRHVPAELRRSCASAGSTWAAQAGAAAGAHGFAFAYPLAEMRELRGGPHFYPPENFHAAGEAAHFAAWTLLDRLYPGEFTPGRLGYRGHTARNDLGSALLFSLPIRLRSPNYGGLRAKPAPKVQARLRSRHPQIRGMQVRQPQEPANPRRAVLIGNSFAEALLPDIAAGFQETVFVPTNSLSIQASHHLFAHLLPDLAPDAVLFVAHDGGIKRDRNALLRMVHAIETPPDAPDAPEGPAQTD